MFSATHEASRNQSSATAGARSRPDSLPLARSVLSDSYLAATETATVTTMHIQIRACNILVSNIALKYIFEILLFKTVVGRGDHQAHFLDDKIMHPSTRGLAPWVGFPYLLGQAYYNLPIRRVAEALYSSLNISGARIL